MGWGRGGFGQIPKQEADPEYRHIMRVEDLPGVATAGGEGKMVGTDESNERPVGREIVGGGEPLEPLNEHEGEWPPPLSTAVHG